MDGDYPQQHGDCRFGEELIDQLPLLVLVLDRDGQIVFVNRYAQELAGLTQAELLGRDFIGEFVPTIDQHDLRQILHRAISQPSDASMPRRINTVVLPNSARREIEWVYRRLVNDAGEVVGVVTVGQDVTDERKAHHDAVQSQRLAAIGQMMTGLAHESRNLLQRSQSCLDLLAGLLGNQPDALDLANRIQIALDQLYQLYEGVRRYAAPINLHRVQGDFTQITRAAWLQLEPLWRERRASVVHRPAGIAWPCFVDVHAMQSVCRNVLENSLAACVDPVEIEIRFALQPVDGQSAQQITFVDNGPGFTPKARQALFQPFFTTKTHGTGLGMSIARRIVEAHGGTIALGDSSPGATITITLPLTAPPENEPIAL
jgi:hypothetical protein